MKTKSKEYIIDLISRYDRLREIETSITQAVEMLIQCYKKGGKLLICGNGGSAADSEHIVGELMKAFILPRKISSTLEKKLSNDYLAKNLQCGLPAISLVSHTALSTAFSNDNAADVCFAQQVLGYGKKEDILLCISTSGNSKNCVYAAQVAKALDMKVISLTGKKESSLSEISDITIKAPETETYKIQEYHLPIYHTICLALENEFFGE